MDIDSNILSVYITMSYVISHSNHVTSSKQVDTLIFHTTMCRNFINFLYFPGHVTLWSLKVVQVVYARVMWYSTQFVEACDWLTFTSHCSMASVFGASTWESKITALHIIIALADLTVGGLACTYFYMTHKNTKTVGWKLCVFCKKLTGKI